LARIIRSPAALMTAYVVVFALSELASAARPTARADVLELLIAVVLAVLAVRGSQLARILMIIYGSLGVLLAVVGSTRPAWALAPRLGVMACCLLQVALLASTPMYQRTRPASARGEPADAPWLPVPRLWALLVSVGAGLGVTLLHIGNLRPIPCPAHVTVLAKTPCQAAGTGFPVAYRWLTGYAQIYDNGNSLRWLNIAAPRGLQVPAFATDWALWTCGILLALYIIGLNRNREYSSPPRPYGAEPNPAGP